VDPQGIHEFPDLSINANPSNQPRPDLPFRPPRLSREWVIQDIVAKLVWPTQNALAERRRFKKFFLSLG
jgi:hypothetical protein